MSATRHYLDHAATAPMRPAAVAAYLAAAGATGNASAIHAAGRAARRLLEDAREDLADALGAHPREVVLTAGGTEADNMGVTGLFRARRAADDRRRRVLVSAVEHPAVSATARALEAEGAQVTEVPVDADGALQVDALEEVLAHDPASVALVACMWANNEVGTVQPVDAVVAAAAAFAVPVHVDAVQALATQPVDTRRLGADTVALSGHKVGGPARAGVLVVRRGTGLSPVLHGGGHEGGLRPGTPDVPAAAALAAAVRETVAGRASEAVRLGALRDRLVTGVLDRVPWARRTAPGARLLPSHAHLLFPGCDSESLLFLLDSRGIEASAGSACRAGVLRPSPVLTAMGVAPDVARSAVRFSLGRTSTDADVAAVLDAVQDIALRSRAAAAA